MLLPLLLARTPKATGSTAEALDLLSSWDGAMLAERPEPLIYTEWMRQFQIALVRDDLGPDLTSQFPRANAVFLGRVLSDVDGAAGWCDDVTSALSETCADMLALSLAAAMDRLSTTQGDDHAAWVWGAAHMATHDHSVLGASPFFAGFVNIRQPSSGGDDTLLRGMTRGTGEEPLQNQHGAVYRALYDLADPDDSLFVVSTGQSGNFLSPHYRDMAALWLRGDYVKLPLDRDALRVGAIGVTLLRPD
jgi:penicillin amidase